MMKVPFVSFSSSSCCCCAKGSKCCTIQRNRLRRFCCQVQQQPHQARTKHGYCTKENDSLNFLQWLDYPYRQKQLLSLLFIMILMNYGTVYGRQLQDDNMLLYDDCDIDTYYNEILISSNDDVTTWQRDDIQNLLVNTHRNVLPYTSSADNGGDDDNNLNTANDDVWMALIDVDIGMDDINTVHLIYRNIDIPNVPYGTPDTWNREHLWPRSRGILESGPDNTDVHHIRPADWGVNAARGNTYFGNCTSTTTTTGTTNNNDDDNNNIDFPTCRVPATDGTTNETASNGVIFLPPLNVRGDIARALFYMDVRYHSSSSSSTVTNLILTDCPTITSSSSSNDDNEDNIYTSEMAYLSQLIEWHLLDPVSDIERQRNDRVCERWQGNRNIFVDYPELVEFIFGSPQPIVGWNEDGYPIYESCSSSNGDNTVVNDDDDEATTDTGGVTTAPATSPTPIDTNLDNTDSDINSVVGGVDVVNVEVCTDLKSGDILPIGYSAIDPDVIVFVTLVPLPTGITLYLTDNAWTGENSGFRTNEGSIKLTIPYDVEDGTIFGYQDDSSSSSSNSILFGTEWEQEQGSFSLSTSGDNVFLYCLNNNFDDEEQQQSTNNENQNNNIRFLFAFSTNGEDEWMDPNLSDDTYDTSSSALPSILLVHQQQQQQEEGAAAIIALPHYDTYQYIGPTVGTKIDILTGWSQSTNWEYSNSDRMDIDTTTSFDESNNGNKWNIQQQQQTNNNDGSSVTSNNSSSSASSCIMKLEAGWMIICTMFIHFVTIIMLLR